MSFFQLSTGENLTQSAQTGAFNANPDILPIPDKTQVRAMCEKAEWDTYEGERNIKITWLIVDGEYKGRKVFHKVKVGLTDAAKRDKALRMLMAIDANAGGGLARLGHEPDDMQLSINLSNKAMVLMLGVWEMGDNKGNWVVAVAPDGPVHNTVQSAPAAPAPQQAAQQGNEPPVDFDDDIPF